MTTRLQSRIKPINRVPHAQGGGVMSWLPSWMGGTPAGPQPMTAEEIERRSWDRDPDVKPMPTDEDAFEAARYKRAHGDPNIKHVDIGDPYKRETGVGFWERAQERRRGADKGPLTPQETDYLRQGQLITNQMPVTYGRFDPSKTSISRGPQSNVAGFANTETGEVWAESNRGQPSTVGHEVGHTAYADLYKTPEGKKLILELDNFITPQDLKQGYGVHELLTRGNLQRNFGPDAEGPVLKADIQRKPGVETSFSGGPGQYQMQRTFELMKNPEVVKRMRALDKLGAHAGAQRLIDRQGMVYNKGGVVNRFQQGGVVPELHEYEQWLRDSPIRYPQAQPRESLNVPIGRGTLSLNPEYTPEQSMGGSARYELPVGNRGWSVGAQGNVDRYIGPGYEQAPVHGGAGVFARKKFQQGGRVSAINTGRVKKYQVGGMVDAEGNPIEVPPPPPPVLVPPPQQQAPPVAAPTQPAPVTGPVTPTVPVTPPTTPAGAPPPTQAIATKPSFVDPLADFKDDAELEAEKREEERMIRGGGFRSIRPGGEFFSGSPPPAPRDLTGHAEYDKLNELKSMLPQIAKEDTSKGQRYYKEAQATVTRMEERMRRETARTYETQHKDFTRQEANEVRKADQARRVGIMQIPDLDKTIIDETTKLATQYPTLIANAKTPEARQEYNMLSVATPLKTMKPNEQALVARNLLNLNHELGQADVAQLLYELSMPPIRGKKGFNGLTGRAAANYKILDKDPVGNYIIETASGPYRVDPRSFGILKIARSQGYDFMTKAHNDYITAKREEEKPGLVTRAIDTTIDAARGLFK
jgi:hypothetical protein